MVSNRSVYGAILRVENGSDTLRWSGASGDLESEDRYFIASVTKLYVTTLLLQLRQEGTIALDDPISKYLPSDLIAGLHVLDGTDRTGQITIRHLMANTSGITDYFFGKGPDGKAAAASLFAGQDEAWPLERIVDRVRTLKPRFVPGQKGKVHYSDTNYELLGRIIETVAGKPVALVFKERIFDVLELTDTYAFTDPHDNSVKPMYYRSSPVHVPRYIASITPEGGIVSTASEVMRFLKAFFAGRFFPASAIDELKRWNRIWFPGQFDFGVGLENQLIPRIMSPFRPIGELLGFWGQSGAFAFYNPSRDLYFTGTVNQLSGFGHSAAVAAMVRIMRHTT
ncbi:MAG: class A beta-lactamase-related serine hydrolase [Spirochaetaceae bacterium]|nr:MAG: class A beta-lactamase-related serine hydrolase [Spirochaetaceae bacterium]